MERRSPVAKQLGLNDVGHRGRSPHLRPGEGREAGFTWELEVETSGKGSWSSGFVLCVHRAGGGPGHELRQTLL